jgi:hypothetical protein
MIEEPGSPRYRCRGCGSFLSPESIIMKEVGVYVKSFIETGACRCGWNYRQLFGEYYTWEKPKVKGDHGDSKKKKNQKELRYWDE